MRSVVHVITGLNDGGAEGVLYRLSMVVADQIDAVVALGNPGKYTEPLRKAGIHVVHLDMPRGRLTLRGLWRLYRFLRKRRPNVVQTWMYHGDLVGGLTARLAGCRNVVWNVRHSELEPKSTGRSTRFVARLCAQLSTVIPRSIITCAERARDVHVELGYDRSKFVVIPNGYDVTRFQPNIAARITLRQQLGLLENLPLIGLVGRWNPQKDHRNLLEAIARLHGSQACTVLLVGSECDPANGELTALLEETGLRDRVHLLGRRNDVPEIMSALDLHVLSSSHGEAFPNVVAEAMASGTPCVVTDVGDAALIVGDTGWVVPPRDPVQLADAISAALNERKDTQRWAQRQDKARRRVVENFSLDTMVARYEAVWSGRDPA